VSLLQLKLLAGQYKLFDRCLTATFGMEAGFNETGVGPDQQIAVLKASLNFAGNSAGIFRFSLIRALIKNSLDQP
jgi:hypothetical protein